MPGRDNASTVLPTWRPVVRVATSLIQINVKLLVV